MEGGENSNSTAILSNNPICVYWRRADRRWSSDGCAVHKRNQSHVTCACDHLTTFAVLMDVRGVRLGNSGRSHRFALSLITFVGCLISIVSCAVAIVAFTFFSGKHPSDRISIHKNLCLCLLIAESVFVLGIGRTEPPLACSVVAALLHYFFLASFAWMLLEGFQLYSLLIEVFEPERSRRPFFYTFGYGMPAVIVAVSLLVDHTSYGTNRHCWLNTDNYFVFSFVGPVAAVLAANVVFLVMALVVMYRHAAFTSAHRRRRQEGSDDPLENTVVWLKGATILVVLLGLTWSFGLLYINESTLVMAYLFTTLNSLQGFLIFLFHVVMNEKVKKEWWKWVARHRSRRTCSSSWMMRGGSPLPPAGGGNIYKPTKAHLDGEPMPVLIGVIRHNTESEQVPLSSSSCSGGGRAESSSLLSKLFGGGQKGGNCGDAARGSVGQLLLVRSGSINSRKTCECPYANYSCCSADRPISRYYVVGPPPLPDCPPPSQPPKMTTAGRHYSPRPAGYYSRQRHQRRPIIADSNRSTITADDRSITDGDPSTMTDDRSITTDNLRSTITTDTRYHQQKRPECGDHDHDHIDQDDHHHYATTDAYFPTDSSDRPDSGYSGSAHHPTPPPPPPPPPMMIPIDDRSSIIDPEANEDGSKKKKMKKQNQNHQLDFSSYEVPMHATANSASTSPYR